MIASTNDFNSVMIAPPAHSAVAPAPGSGAFIKGMRAAEVDEVLKNIDSYSQWLWETERYHGHQEFVERCHSKHIDPNVLKILSARGEMSDDALMDHDVYKRQLLDYIRFP